MSENDATTAPEATTPGDSGEPNAADIPREMAILPLFNVVIYPLTVIPLAVGQEQSIKLIDEAVLGERMIGLVTLTDEQQRPEHVTPDDFYKVGTAALVHRLLRLPDNTLRVAVQGVERIEIEEITQTEPYFRARVRVVPDEASADLETAALQDSFQFRIGFRTINRVNDPFYEVQVTLACIAGCKHPQSRQYALTTSFDLRQFHGQLVLGDAEFPQDFRGTCAKNNWRPCKHPFFKSLIRQRKHLRRRIAFDQDFARS